MRRHGKESSFSKSEADATKTSREVFSLMTMKSFSEKTKKKTYELLSHICSIYT